MIAMKRTMSEALTILLFTAAVLVPADAVFAQDDSARPNVVILLADDMGYADPACYAERHGIEQHARTPTVDRLAEQGTLFTDFYAGQPVCSPSRAALLTGRRASRTGVYWWIPSKKRAHPDPAAMHLRSEEVTLAERLTEAGYATAHMGKWHLTAEGQPNQPHPRDQGFDYSFFTYNNADPSHRNPRNFIRNGKQLGKLDGYSSHLVAEEAIRWLDEEWNTDQPFYLNLWFHEPHVPLAAPQALKDHYDSKSKYYGCIENMDRAINRVLKALEERGVADNTLVIFSSDNGSYQPGSNRPLYGEKVFLYEGGVRVPTIVRWPGHVPAGRVSHAAGSFTDILPTVCDIAGIDPPSDRPIDGVSLKEVWTGAEESPERDTPIFFYGYTHEPITMLREGPWVLLGFMKDPEGKRPLVKHPPNAEEKWKATPKVKHWHFAREHMKFLQKAEPNHFQLYNVAREPGQATNVADDHPKRVRRMKKRTLKLRREMVEDGGDWFDPSDGGP